MKFALIAFSDNHVYRSAIKAEMVRRGHVCDLKYFPVLPIDADLTESVFQSLSQYDVVHFILGFNSELAKELQGRLVAAGVVCPNQRTSVTNLNDKVVQMAVLAKKGVPTPKSFRLMNPKKDEISKTLGFPFVVKAPVGSKGATVALCTEKNFDEVIKKNRELLGQEFIRYTADYRVHVIGEKTFCIYERIAPAGDFRANVSLGGAMKKVTDTELQTDLSELALRAARALSVDYGGIDIIRDKDGKLLVLEFNSNPGFKNVTDITGVPFYVPIVDYYESLIS
jgi:RimK family alpha-L-glutamate ligase